MNTMHRGVHNDQYVSYVIRVRPLGPSNERTTRNVYIVEVISEQLKRLQFESLDSVIAFLRAELDDEPFDSDERQLSPIDEVVPKTNEKGE